MSHFNFKDKTGQVYGRLTVLSLVGKNKSHYDWLCQCECGNKKIISGATLRPNAGRHAIRSCGCLLREHCADMTLANIAHGNSGRGRTREYNVWCGIKNRCDNPKDSSYQYYGGRGITMCDRWRHSFDTFLSDLGKKPTPLHSLDRINVNGNYEPSNCRWATKAEQARNRRNSRFFTILGETLHLFEWCERFGMPPITIHNRLQRNWTIERALTQPVRKFL